MRATGTTIKFPSVRLALQECDIEYTPHDTRSVLTWIDSRKEVVKTFLQLKSWQCINRIPNMNSLCLKVSGARFLREISQYFPDLYSFVPKTLIIPEETAALKEAMAQDQEKEWILKPDNGSLGDGITIVKGHLASEICDSQVAQEYIESILINGKKFDLRVYALVSSLDPLCIYVYKDGVARFCSESYQEGTLFSRLTNVALNKQNLKTDDFKEISKLISEITPTIKEMGGNIDKIWTEIEDAICLTIMSAYPYLRHSEKKVCPRSCYSRCFQILGFDILLAKDWKPYVLEVNYRPLLDFHRPREKRMKVAMIRDAIRIAAPLRAIQEAFDARDWSWENHTWNAFLVNNPAVLEMVNEDRREAEMNNGFALAWPCRVEDARRQRLGPVLKKVTSLYSKHSKRNKTPESPSKSENRESSSVGIEA